MPNHKIKQSPSLDPNAGTQHDSGGFPKTSVKPWIAQLGEVHEVRDGEGGRVCILTQLRGAHGLGGRRPGGESAANAHLMAAAPELLEALEQCITFLAPHVRPASEDTYAAVIRAIAKAEGRNA